MNMRLPCFLLLMFLSCCLNAAALRAVEMKQEAGKTSLFFSLDGTVAHKVFTLTNPDRVVIDFDDTNLAFNINQLKLNNKLIKHVRSGRPNAHTLRLVFEVTDTVMLRATAGRENSATRHAFSLDLSANKVLANKVLANKILPGKAKVTITPPNKISHPPTTIVKQNPVHAPVPVAIKHIPPRSLRDVVIVLDAGHGGKDPGASGPKHSVEKNITLAIALKLKDIIDRQPGMKAVLTRHGDYYVGLRDRLHIARKYNGDIFISIHADAFINQQSNGASVFALSQGGATSEAARWLAEKENYSELGGVNLAGLDDQSGLVRTVLIDLSQTATIGASLHMGQRVLRNLDTITTLHNNKVEQARFMVLKSPDIPSILIETGFISNPREENNLTSGTYQTRLTQAIFQGLKGYFWEYPPHGTQIEALVGNNTHLATGGEAVFQSKQLS